MKEDDRDSGLARSEDGPVEPAFQVIVLVRLLAYVLDLYGA